VAAEPNLRATGPIVFAVATGPERRACSAVIPTAAGSEAGYAHFLQTGSGPLRLDMLVERVTKLRASGLISIGTAGGLAPDLAPGTLLLPKRILLHNGMAKTTDPDWRDHVYAALTPHFPVDTGDLLTAPELVRHPEQKRALHSDTKAVGVDMESGQLAQLAERIGIRFLVLRAVMDAVDDEIPGAALVAVNEQGDTAAGALLKYLLRHPGDLAGMIRTARRFQVAAGSLRQAARLARDSLLRPG
jgi:adenosylhomocysteine nucleosidase